MRWHVRATFRSINIWLFEARVCETIDAMKKKQQKSKPDSFETKLLQQAKPVGVYARGSICIGVRAQMRMATVMAAELRKIAAKS